MKKKISLSVMTLLLVKSIYAFDLGLGKVGKDILSSLASAFPYIVGIAFILVGFRAFNEYNESGKDYMVPLKIFIWFVIVVLIFVGLYQFLMTQVSLK